MKENKILIVLASNIHWAPYYYKYEQMLTNNGISFDLLLWNRENINENTKANNIIEFRIKDKSNNKNPLKVFKFLKFSSFVKRTIRSGKYDKLVFLGTHGCAPVFLANYLKKNYLNEYWLDIRDYQYEWFKPFYLLEKKTITNSYCTCISSKGYEDFLPKYNYNYIHNIDPNMDYILKNYNVEKSNFIRISFIGNVRYFDENVKLVNILANDERFRLQFYGAGSEKIQKYCEENSINNTDFFGRFSMNDTISFYNKTDIINNIYGNNSITLTTALSNKLYYSIYLKLPILVCKNTFMSKLSKKYQFGFEFSQTENFANDLYNFYNEFKSKNNDKIDELRKQVELEEIETEKKLIEFLKD